MKKLLVLALVLVAASAFAQTDPGTNGVGIYFDQTGTSNCNKTAAAYTPVVCYVVATNIAADALGVKAWEMSVQMISSAYFQPPSVTILNDGSNMLSYPQFNVGLPIAVGVGQSAIPLARFDLFYMGGEVTMGIGVGTPPTIPHGPCFVTGVSAGDVRYLVPSGNVPFPGFADTWIVASIQGATCPVANVPGTWTSVKNLYQ